MTAETGGAVSAPHGRPPLDDIMLAMDVVDTLRRRERLVLKELDDAGREEDLKQRLRAIYSQQGIEVPDHVLDQGVAALKEDRFTYKPRQAGVARRLALIYVGRGRWSKWLGGGLAAAVLAAAANYFMVIAPDRALPEELARRHAEVVAVAASDHARETAQKIHDAGTAALRSDDSEAAKAALGRLEQLRNSLEREYTIRIVNRPGERSGVWRVPDVNQSAKNFYVIVEAVGADGERLEVTVQNEETGTSERVDVWGLRVDEATFDAIGRDKQDDGIIENDRFGYKRRGHLQPEYEMPSSGGAITRW
ncbi:MAG: hypothetical protein KJN79_03780 [Gammaproteobacteria bacterium]|nr:hypothetical protein [Gammaproteobacteria bacterium]